MQSEQTDVPVCPSTLPPQDIHPSSGSTVQGLEFELVTAPTLIEFLTAATPPEVSDYAAAVSRDLKILLHEFRVTVKVLGILELQSSPDPTRLQQLKQRAQKLERECTELSNRTSLVQLRMDSFH